MGLLIARMRVGTTSAHAENTFFGKENENANRNYLRARGEYTL